MAMEVLARTLFSGTEGIAATTEVKRSLPALLDGMGRRAYLPVNFVHRLPLPANRRFQQARARLNAVVDGIIADYRATGTDRGDLLSLLVLAVDEETGQGMSEQQLRDEVLTMLIGGTETTATTIAWVLHLVATYPEVEAAVHAEVDEVLAGQPASHEHLPRLDYCRRVVMETLRMYPIGWLLTRNALTDVDLGRPPDSGRRGRLLQPMVPAARPGDLPRAGPVRPGSVAARPGAENPAARVPAVQRGHAQVRR